MRSHAGFGGRPAETERPKGRHRAAGRPYLATDALDEVRREVWNQAGKSGDITAAKDLKGARYALWKSPENLTDRQHAKLSSIQKTNARLYRAYLLKEQLRQIYRLPAKEAVELLDEWIAWARRCRLASFVKLARTITAQRAGIVAAIEHGLSNACPSTLHLLVGLWW